MYFNQLLLAARKAHVVYSDQLLGAAPCIHFISNHDTFSTEPNYGWSIPNVKLRINVVNCRALCFDAFSYLSIWIDSKPIVWDFSWYVSDINLVLVSS